MCVMWIASQGHKCELEPENQFCTFHTEKPKPSRKEREKIRKKKVRENWPSSIKEKSQTRINRIKIYIDPIDPEWEMITNEW